MTSETKNAKNKTTKLSAFRRKKAKQLHNTNLEVREASPEKQKLSFPELAKLDHFCYFTYMLSLSFLLALEITLRIIQSALQEAFFTYSYSL